jgi:hypothetical protein
MRNSEPHAHSGWLGDADSYGCSVSHTNTYAYPNPNLHTKLHIHIGDRNIRTGGN